MKHRIPFAGLLVLATATLLLTGCAAPPTPAPPTAPLPPTATAPAAPALRAPTMTPPPVASAAPVPSATPAPSADAYEGWQTVATGEFTIRLPAGWQVLDLSAQNLSAMLAALEPRQEGIGWQPDPAEAAEGLALVAVSDGGDGPDSLNIRRAPLGAQRIEDPAALAAAFVPQMEILGLTVTEQRADLRTLGGLPMARLTYSMVPAEDGQPAMRGEQYHALTDTDVWVLTFTSAAMEAPAARPEFAQSAETFAPRS